MRVFLIYKNVDGTESIHAEVLSYDRSTNMMRVRVKGGIEYDRHFLPNAKHNRSNFRIATTESDDA